MDAVPIEIGAMLFRWDSTFPAHIRTWAIGSSELTEYETGDIATAIGLTNRLLVYLEQHIGKVPEGWDQQDMDFLYEALTDGHQELVAEYLVREELEDAGEVFNGILEGTDFIEQEGLEPEKTTI